jgi:hypothetical protein
MPFAALVLILALGQVRHRQTTNDRSMFGFSPKTVLLDRKIDDINISNGNGCLKHKKGNDSGVTFKSTFVLEPPP